MTVVDAPVLVDGYDLVQQAIRIAEDGEVTIDVAVVFDRVDGFLEVEEVAFAVGLLVDLYVVVARAVGVRPEFGPEGRRGGGEGGEEEDEGEEEGADGRHFCCGV